MQGVTVWVACGRVQGARNKAREGGACGALLGVVFQQGGGVLRGDVLSSIRWLGPSGRSAPGVAGALFVSVGVGVGVAMGVRGSKECLGPGEGHRYPSVPALAWPPPLRAASRNCFSRVSQRALLGSRGDTARGVLLSAC